VIVLVRSLGARGQPVHRHHLKARSRPVR
jgi:hypothetical protein